MSKKQISVFITFAFLLICFSFNKKRNKFIEIPTQKICLDQIIGDTFTDIYTVKSFQISEFVTFKEYKIYLNEIKKDSTIEFYNSQLPDTNIGSKEVWLKYNRRKRYDNLPVLGISWDNAMNFCKWKTISENNDTIKFVYRLPKCSEWVTSYAYFQKNNIKNDLNKNYSDWTLSIKDESMKEFKTYNNNNWFYDYHYFSTPQDPPSMKRKVVIGNSFLYQNKKILFHNNTYYSTQGYRQISFRLVKDFDLIDPKAKKNMNSDSIKLKKEFIFPNINLSILHEWGLSIN